MVQDKQNESPAQNKERDHQAANSHEEWEYTYDSLENRI